MKRGNNQYDRETGNVSTFSFIDRYEEVETMVVPLKESEQEVAFENLDSLTHVQKFYYGQCTFIIQRTEFIEKLLIEKSLRTSFGMKRIF